MEEGIVGVVGRVCESNGVEGLGGDGGDDVGGPVWSWVVFVGGGAGWRGKCGLCVDGAGCLVCVCVCVWNGYGVMASFLG